jgi:hypothetical protein
MEGLLEHAETSGVIGDARSVKAVMPVLKRHAPGKARPNISVGERSPMPLSGRTRAGFDFLLVIAHLLSQTTGG